MSFNRKSTSTDVLQGIDLSGQTILVTGVNSGLGEQTLQSLASHGAHVIAAARTLEKAQAASRHFPDNTTALACELSDLATVSAAAEQVKQQFGQLDALVCNAGIMALPSLQQSQGLEMQFMCNHVGHFLLIQKLLPLLEKAPQGRIVLVSSDGHKHTVKGGINFANLSGEQGYDAWKFYGQSKLANILTARTLSKRLQNSSVTANALHPGVIRTNLSRNMAGLMSTVIGLFAPLFEKSVAQGAATQVYLAAHPDAAQYNGQYFADVQPKQTSQHGRDDALADRLWAFTDDFLGTHL